MRNSAKDIPFLFVKTLTHWQQTKSNTILAFTQISVTLLYDRKCPTPTANYCYFDVNLRRLERLYHQISIKRHLSACESQAIVDRGCTHRRVNIRTEVLLRFNPLFSKD